jgi:hypothetical protein
VVHENHRVTAKAVGKGIVAVKTNSLDTLVEPGTLTAYGNECVPLLLMANRRADIDNTGTADLRLIGNDCRGLCGRNRNRGRLTGNLDIPIGMLDSQICYRVLIGSGHASTAILIFCGLQTSLDECSLRLHVFVLSIGMYPYLTTA